MLKGGFNMKKMISFAVSLILAGFIMGCDSTSDKVHVGVSASDVVIPATTASTSAKKILREFDSTTYPQIQITVTFHCDGASYSGVSGALSPDTREIQLNNFYSFGSPLGLIWIISSAQAGFRMDFEGEGESHHITMPEMWANDYDVTVYYYVSSSEVYSDTKSYTITTDEYKEKFTQVGIGPCTVLTYDGYYNNTGQTFGDLGFWEFTAEQEANVALYASFDVSFEE